MSIVYNVIRNGAVIYSGNRNAAYKRALKGDRVQVAYATKR